MPVKNYAVWAGKPISYTAETEAQDSRSPHLYLKYSDDTPGEKSTAINVKSISRDGRLVYWVHKNFQHPITTALRQLPLGLHPIDSSSSSSSELGLDFQRTDPPLLTFAHGLILPHDIPGPDNDVLDELTPIVQAAISDGGATVYIFGQSYATGIHDVHMNQGSLPRFENGVGQDGGLIVQFSDGHFEAVFLAFASQMVPTDDRGLATADARALAEVARSLRAGGTATDFEESVSPTGDEPQARL